MFWIVTGLIFLAGVVGVVALLRVAGDHLPEPVDNETRDQIIAQNRTFSGQRPEPGDPTWDGQKRGPVPVDPGSGAGG